jgi:hypothetical protein
MAFVSSMVQLKIIIMKKKLIAFAMAGCFLFFTAAVHAQDSTTTVGQDLKNAAKKTGKAIGKGAKKVGNKTAELASKGKSVVVDKVFEGKEGPDGQTIYINKDSKYYWVDKKGHHKFIAESKLKDKS